MDYTHIKIITFTLITFFALKSNAQEEAKAKAAKDGNSAATIAAQVSSLNREEKNAMIRCPLHNKHMSISDNYRANASDYTESDNYPFAYQLNYRRYCTKCTKIMQREAHIFDVEPGMIAEKCILHNQILKNNSDWDKFEKEENPSVEMPHAKQYLQQYYCTVCTKVYKIQNK